MRRLCIENTVTFGELQACNTSYATMCVSHKLISFFRSASAQSLVTHTLTLPPKELPFKLTFIYALSVCFTLRVYVMLCTACLHILSQRDRLLKCLTITADDDCYSCRFPFFTFITRCGIKLGTDMSSVMCDRKPLQCNKADAV